MEVLEWSGQGLVREDWIPCLKPVPGDLGKSTGCKGGAGLKDD